MRRLLFASALAAFSLFAEKTPTSYWDFHPLHGGGNGIWIGGAEVSPKKGDAGGDLHFRKANAYLTILLPISHKTYFFPRVEWDVFTVKWNQNPKFDASTFSYLQFGLTFYSIALERWRWIARVDYNLDTKHFSKPGLYGLTTGLVWGKYEIHRKWHYHVGATGYVGLEGSTIYPIIGADYSPNKTWTIEAIFPISYAVQYHLTDWCRLSIKGRPLRERFRTGKHEIQPRSVFNYSSMGAEFNVFMEKKRRIEAEFYAGYNFGGAFYIKNEHGHNAYYTNLGGAPYFGANLDFGF
jgi:hypothetical protein